jgi:hypothetical protein
VAVLSCVRRLRVLRYARVHGGHVVALLALARPGADDLVWRMPFEGEVIRVYWAVAAEGGRTEWMSWTDATRHMSWWERRGYVVWLVRTTSPA